MLGIKRGTWDPLLPLPWRTATMLMIPLTPDRHRQRTTSPVSPSGG